MQSPAGLKMPAGRGQIISDLDYCSVSRSWQEITESFPQKLLQNLTCVQNIFILNVDIYLIRFILL